MPSRWLRWSRSPREDCTHTEIPTELTSAFLEMEHRLDIAQRAVEVATALRPEAILVTEWEAARDQAYAATAQYLAVVAPDSTTPTARLPLPEVARGIDTARAGLDAFYDRHRHTLGAAVGAATTARAAADDALAGALQATNRLSGLAPELAGYPSVQSARELVDTARADIQSALERGDITAAGSAASRLHTVTAALNEAIAAAPQRTEHATRTLASVRTRMEATSHRADAIGTIFSTLLKEFHADSSADLVDNERRARIHLGAALDRLERASHALDEHRPEDATAEAAQARDELSRAEDLVDAVSDRLTTLRALRADPTRPERDIRFRVRDAQRLAVDRGAVAEWGTVLDAQVTRVDRIVAGLGGRHPDYWEYHLELEEVAQFVSTVINRIRHQSATQ